MSSRSESGSPSDAVGDVPAIVQRAILGAVLLYFATFIYASVADDQTARTVAYVLFGFIAVGVGVLLISQSRSQLRGDDGLSIIAVAGASLVVGGLAQLAWVATKVLVLELVSTAAVIIGMALYVYEVWIAS